jgi:hypothetical protein
VAPVATTAAAPTATPAKDAVFSPPELDQMVAPIALYPDPLLAQVLMAATYPGDVADAAAWSKLHLDAKGDAAVQQAASQPWDPSVQSLVAFPQVLATLGQDLGWVQRLGDAFLAQPDDVMDAVQRLRHKAQAAGHLDSNKYQTVSVAAEAAAPAPAPTEGAMPSAPASETTIVIAPSDPEVIYVPSYNPTEVYGAWDYPAYPPVYYAPPPMYTAGGALWRGLAFGTGIAISNALWGDMDWGGNDININASRYNNINVNRNINTGNTAWRHDSLHRDGVPYRDSASREQFDRRLPGAETREGFRGDDPQRAQARQSARSSMERRGVDTSAAGARELANAQARDLARVKSENKARDRARQETAARDRAARDSGARDSGARDTARRQQGQQDFHARGDSTSQSRQAAQRQRSSQSSARDNAFQGAGSPQQSRQQAQRGQSSHRQASSGSHGGSRGGGQQVQRSAPPPRQSGGGRRR